MKEENVQAIPEESSPESEQTDLGKFKSVDALARAYKELEAEFTRRSQRLKALESHAQVAEEPRSEESGKTEEDDEALYLRVTGNEGVRTRVLSDYLRSLKGVPLMAGGGASVTAPAQKPKNIREAGSLALGYLRKN